MTNIIHFPTKPCLFRVGDTFTSADGVKIHVIDQRSVDGKRQLLFSAHGTKIWADDDRFVRIN